MERTVVCQGQQCVELRLVPTFSFPIFFVLPGKWTRRQSQFTVKAAKSTLEVPASLSLYAHGLVYRVRWIGRRARRKGRWMRRRWSAPLMWTGLRIRADSADGSSAIVPFRPSAPGCEYCLDSATAALLLAHPTTSRATGLFFSNDHVKHAMSNLNAVFSDLRAIIEPYAAKLSRTKDDDTELYVDTSHVQKNKKPLFFGAVQIKKAYVSYHLMPVYVKPELLDGMSAELKARMQGKSCFNFATSEKPLFKELAALTKAGFASYKTQGFV